MSVRRQRVVASSDFVVNAGQHRHRLPILFGMPHLTTPHFRVLASVRLAHATGQHLGPDVRYTSAAVWYAMLSPTPVVSLPLPPSGRSPQAGRSAAEHGGAREPTPRPRPRRAPFADLPRRPVTVRVVTGGVAWQS